MANEYADLPSLKASLGIASTDTTRDLLLGEKLEAAARSIDDHCGRVFYKVPLESRVFRPADRIADEVFLVDDLVVGEGFLVETGNSSDGWTAVATDLEFYPENADKRGEPVTGLVNVDGWALGYRDRVRVSAEYGFPAVPPQIIEATLILAARLYRRKDTPEGVLGSAEWGTVRIARTDPDVAELISRFVLLGFA